ncbi:MAG: metalloregulator ArsR/SmtB family transcription factor [Acidimicrobiales bacterium]
MRDVQRILGALNSPIRRRILTLIWDRQLPASEIAAAFKVTAPTVSQHLAVLREANLVTMTAQGNFRLYRAKQEVLRGLHGALAGNSPKWTPADDIPERDLALAETRPVVVAQVEVDSDQATTFKAFTDPAVYSRWMGVPVLIEDGRFSCTLEWGTQVEGVYELVLEPALIALRWSFEDGNVPIPGGDMVGYLRFAPAGEGCRVEVHQLIDTAEQAAFMEAAWKLVLGRLKSGVVAASDGRAGPATPRPPRQKQRRSA